MFLVVALLRHLGRFEEALQMAHACRVTQLAQRLRLNLAYAFARDVIHLADFFERAFVTVKQAETHFENFPFALGQGCQHVAQFLAEQTIARHFGWIFRRLVLDEIADAYVEMCIRDRKLILMLCGVGLHNFANRRQLILFKIGAAVIAIGIVIILLSKPN